MTICILTTVGLVPVTSIVTMSSFEGSMFASDAGVAVGGFEWTASYYTSLEWNGETGMLNITLKAGLGSHFENWEDTLLLPVTHAGSISNDKVEIQTSHGQIVLVRTENHSLWEHAYDGWFIAACSLDPEERIGTINGTVFPGFIPEFYVEMRFPPAIIDYVDETTIITSSTMPTEPDTLPPSSTFGFLLSIVILPLVVVFIFSRVRSS